MTTWASRPRAGVASVVLRAIKCGGCHHHLPAPVVWVPDHGSRIQCALVWEPDIDAAVEGHACGAPVTVLGGPR